MWMSISGKYNVGTINVPEGNTLLVALFRLNSVHWNWPGSGVQITGQKWIGKYRENICHFYKSFLTRELVGDRVHSYNVYGFFKSKVNVSYMYTCNIQEMQYIFKIVFFSPGHSVDKRFKWVPIVRMKKSTEMVSSTVLGQTIRPMESHRESSGSSGASANVHV